MTGLWLELAGLGIAALFVAHPRTRDVLAGWSRGGLRRLRRLARRPAAAIAAVAAVGFVGSALVAAYAGLPLPRVQDEFSYLLAADTFAQGRLTNPPHPMWDFFETFHVLQQPSYMSKYPPAQGAILALGQVLGHPAVGLWLSAALLGGALCWMLMGWVPRPWAVLGALLAVARLGVGTYWTQSYWGGCMPAVGGALVLGGLRRCLDRPRPAPAVALAVGVALLANSRPFEGFVSVLPAAAWLVAGALAGRRRPRLSRTLLATVLPVAAVLVPAAAFMLHYNRAVAGDPLVLPYHRYTETYSNLPYLRGGEIGPEPVLRHEPMRRFYEESARTFRARVGSYLDPGEGFRILAVASSFYLGLGLSTVAVFAAAGAPADRWRALALSTCVLVWLGNSLIGYWWLHYFAPATAALWLLAVEGLRRVPLWLGRQRGRGVLAGLVLALLPPLAFQVRYDWERGQADMWHRERAAVLEALRHSLGRDLVVVRYGFHVDRWEWVYNRADIDGAEVVWARDLGDDNRRLLAYFAGRRAWLLEVDETRPLVLRPYPRASPRDGRAPPAAALTDARTRPSGARRSSTARDARATSGRPSPASATS